MNANPLINYGSEDCRSVLNLVSGDTVKTDGTVGTDKNTKSQSTDDVWMTNSPLSEHAISRQQAFLPISEALLVKAGDIISATVMARPADHLIAWEVSHPATGKKFSHSTWQGDLLLQEQLLRNRPDRAPRLSRIAQARSVVLGYCDGKLSVAQIQETVLREHADLFPSPEEIKRFVTAVLTGNTE